MSPRPKKDAAPAAKADPKKGKAAKPAAEEAKEAKGAKGPKPAAKAAKGKKNEPSDQIPVIEGQAVDPDELEEAEDEAAAARSSGSSNDAALAAAGGSGEMSASFKNFRHHPDMENFYRFIYENDLRHEALAIIDEIMVEKRKKKLAKGGKAAH